ncbi:hypothetical protein N7510_008441 [Penicillium lagena]|uniref:uncharacterized protein n=1 Tax=Penicillium lagena TaxID=94218 RepID=UPI0025410D9B|nr:uncharacterized protein N7510_008441 [Penicillium lagena]KAJ5605660.1 hypothetical protein N7510_008441 [Penicillium lagena]
MASAFLSPQPSDTTTTDPLLVTVRFSASIPDLHLDVPEPESTTGAGLKQLIRTNLPPSLSAHRLRLIYAGRGLEDTAPLTFSLKLPLSPSRSPRLPITDDDDDDGEEDHDDGSSTANGKGKGKGKQPVRDTRPRLYIHCSIGDIALTDADLVAEAGMASTLLLQQRKDEGYEKTSSNLFRSQTKQPRQHQQQHPATATAAATTTTTPAPRGFDRLLAAGFTPAEVTALRSQFLAVQSVSRTPDTMPSGEELRDLEDRWMDEGSTAAQAQAGVVGLTGVVGGLEGMMMGGLGLVRGARWTICFGER